MPVDLSVPQFIISSMMAAKQLRQQKMRDQASIEAQGAETDLKRQQHEQQAKEFDDMLKHLKIQNESELTRIDAQKAQTKALHQANQIELLKAYRRGDVAPTGTTQTSLGDAISDKMGASMFQQSPAINIGGENISLAGGVSPDQANQQAAKSISVIGSAQAAAAGEHAGAVAAATEPYNINKFSREQGGRETIEGMKAFSDQIIAEGHNNAQKLIGEMHNQMERDVENKRSGTQMGIAAMHYGGLNKDKIEARNKFRTAAAAGDLPVDMLQPAEREFVLPDLVASGGFYTTAQLKDAGVAAQALNALKSLREISDQVAKISPAKSNFEAMGRNAKMFATQTDLYKRFNEAAALISGLGRALGERGAFSNQDREVYNKALIGLNKSDSANTQALSDLGNLFYKKATDSLSEAKPELSRKILKSKFNIDPPSGGYSPVSSFADSLPSHNSQGHTLDKDNSNRLRRPIYYEDQ